ncbi:SRPBCC family protein [Fimbriimonas ginsengisoli]|uniref:Putative glutathione S-transferase-related transmembrane protein n=1 Tax=Fimbriimonas ginsengisoli Gsoil 348 TaxID=661478 RepID=A0A068NWU4_FIMGI|nr:SRPBCC domain-containing protein [Fimbriimonas ginsengisoli]AIE87916.1 putative glutathione S-transferase-related transmembrane protein [Fimbriimonas ginsengisoli Gsoil 348]
MREREVLITRVFDAPRELVFRAWTDPEHLRHWFAPHGCEVEILSLDVRPGGEFRYGIRPPKGADCWCRGTYLEVTSPERIVYSIALTDEHGRFTDSVTAGKDPDWPAETVVTVTFAERAGKTEVTLHQNALESVAKRTGAYPSWLQMLDRLAEELRRHPQ